MQVDARNIPRIAADAVHGLTQHPPEESQTRSMLSIVLFKLSLTGLLSF